MKSNGHDMEFGHRVWKFYVDEWLKEDEMISQAVAEATKNTSSIFLDGIAVMALIGASGFAAREYLRTRRIRRNGNGNGNNRNSKPGTAPECKEHREKLIRLDEKTGNMKEDIVEIKQDVKELLRRVRTKD